MTVNIISNWQELYSIALQLFTGDEPFFLARIGGSDTDAVLDYLAIQDGNEESFARAIAHLDMVTRFNGFYDISGSYEKYFSYLNELIRCYVASKHISMSGPEILTLYIPESINPRFLRKTITRKESCEKLITMIEKKHDIVTFYPYTFIEKANLDPWAFFRVLSKCLVGLRVLVISPFAKSIEKNFGSRAEFFKEYEYPKFHLELYNTPVTYAGLSKEMYPHADWFETTEVMMEAIGKINFDIALLSCGSYAMPLGSFIEHGLKKKAIYVGGVLQLYFGVMGRRFNNPYYVDQIHPEKFIYPIERENFIEQVEMNNEGPKEAFGAYF